MKTEQITKELRSMIGRTFSYREQEITFTDYVVKGSVYCLSFGDFKIQKDIDQMVSFIPLLTNNEVIDNPMVALATTTTDQEPQHKYEVKATETSIKEAVTSGSTKILDVLDEMILMVKSNPNAIKQAMAINSLCKTKLDTHKTILKIAK